MTHSSDIVIRPSEAGCDYRSRVSRVVAAIAQSRGGSSSSRVIDRDALPRGGAPYFATPTSSSTTPPARTRSSTSSPSSCAPRAPHPLSARLAALSPLAAASISLLFIASRSVVPNDDGSDGRDQKWSAVPESSPLDGMQHSRQHLHCWENCC